MSSLQDFTSNAKALGLSDSERKEALAILADLGIQPDDREAIRILLTVSTRSAVEQMRTEYERISRSIENQKASASRDITSTFTNWEKKYSEIEKLAVARLASNATSAADVLARECMSRQSELIDAKMRMYASLASCAMIFCVAVGFVVGIYSGAAVIFHQMYLDSLRFEDAHGQLPTVATIALTLLVVVGIHLFARFVFGPFAIIKVLRRNDD